MLKIGITGGIGTGKSFVCEIFKLMNIPIYDADSQAKRLVTENIEIKAEIVKLLGAEAYDKFGVYNRIYVANTIFENESLKNELNKIIHPAVQEDANGWFAKILKSQPHLPYAIKEAAILFESNSHPGLDKIIVVDAPLSLRIQRIQKRDQINKGQILARMKNQWPNEKKIAMADFVIYNDGQAGLIKQIEKVHHELIKLTSSKLDTQTFSN